MTWKTSYLSPWPLSLYLHDDPEDDHRYADHPVQLRPAADPQMGALVPMQGSQVGVTLPAASFFIHRARKDPYVKSKLKFERRPKLPVINETPSNSGTLTASEIAHMGRGRGKGSKGSRSSSSGSHKGTPTFRRRRRTPKEVYKTIHDSLRRSWNKDMEPVLQGSVQRTWRKRRRREKEAEMELLEWKLQKLQSGLQMHRPKALAMLEPLEPVMEGTPGGGSEEGYIEASDPPSGLGSRSDRSRSVSEKSSRHSRPKSDRTSRSDEHLVEEIRVEPEERKKRVTILDEFDHEVERRPRKGYYGDRGSYHSAEESGRNTMSQESSFYSDSGYYTSTLFTDDDDDDIKDNESIFMQMKQKKRLYMCFCLLVAVLVAGVTSSGVAVYFVLAGSSKDSPLLEVNTTVEFPMTTAYDMTTSNVDYTSYNPMNDSTSTRSSSTLDTVQFIYSLQFTPWLANGTNLTAMEWWEAIDAHNASEVICDKILGAMYENASQASLDGTLPFRCELSVLRSNSSEVLLAFTFNLTDSTNPQVNLTVSSSPETFPVRFLAFLKDILGEMDGVIEVSDQIMVLVLPQTLRYIPGASDNFESTTPANAILNVTMTTIASTASTEIDTVDDTTLGAQVLDPTSPIPNSNDPP